MSSIFSDNEAGRRSGRPTKSEERVTRCWEGYVRAKIRDYSCSKIGKMYSGVKTDEMMTE